MISNKRFFERKLLTKKQFDKLKQVTIVYKNFFVTFLLDLQYIDI